MKNNIFIVTLSFALFTAKAQTKIYDFPFNGTLSANVGTGTFTSMLGTNYNTDRNSLSNNSLSLNNTLPNDATLTGLPTGSNRRTVSLWFNRQGPGDVGLFAYGANAPLEKFGVYFGITGQLVFQGYGTGNDSILNIPGVSYNSWHHLAVMYTGTNIKIYFNGSLTNTFPKSLNTASGNFKLGNMIGYYDDLKIYDDTLTGVQLMQVFTNNDFTSTATINDAAVKNNIALYPNPANEMIKLTNVPIGSTIVILDFRGIVLNHLIVTNEQTTINTTNFASGPYLIRIENNEMTVNKKLFIIK